MKVKKIILSSLIATLLVGCGGSDIVEEVLTTGGVNIPQSSLSDIEKAVIRHNEIRNELFNDSNVTWSYELATSAQTYADTLATNGEFEHDNSPYGENLFTASYQVDYLDAVNSWYGEKSYYDYTSNSCVGGECGHYTQIIWKNSTEIGCGIAKYTTGNYKNWLVIVCRYNPPGNYIGQKPY